ncbi:GntR family transcriptional regulator [Hyphococcus sp.]|uniref:GntR family transcriptional regulator n=1 Tax=Hyphococcus sp. TaxID=2038636 RepID=UPI0035C748DA
MTGRRSITEIAYDKLTDTILSGALAPGARLDANVIAAREGVSPTPIRCALNRLVGAGLLISHAKEGFFTPACTEQDLRDAYESVAALLGLAISSAEAAPRKKARKPDIATANEDAVALRTERAFRDIMALCGNRRLLHAFDSVNPHLRPARHLEMHWIPNAPSELGRICEARDSLDFAELKKRIDAYHRRRIRLVREIVAHMHASDKHALLDPASGVDES